MHAGISDKQQREFRWGQLAPRGQAQTLLGEFPVQQ